MKEAIYRCLAHSRGKRKTRLTCPSSAQPTTGQPPAGSSLHTGVQKAPHPAGPRAQKRSTRRHALLSLRLLLILVSLCASFLLTLAMPAVVTFLALAASHAAHVDPGGEEGESAQKIA